MFRIRIWLLLLLVSSFSLSWQPVDAVPPAVELSSAIVAAVEQDAEEEADTEQRLERAWMESAEKQVWLFLNDELNEKQLRAGLDSWAAEARGKRHKRKKILKMLYPLIGAAIVAKMVLLPLILKAVTVLSTSSFVMAKIALIISGLLALKWILSGGMSHDRLEIVHSASPSIKTFHGGGAGAFGDLANSGSSWWPVRQRYIPLSRHNYDPMQVDKPFL